MLIPLLLVINNFFHDFSAAMLLCSAACIYMVRRNFHGHTGAASDSARKVISRLTVIFYLSLGFVVIGGAIRAWAYQTYEWITPLGQSQITVLAVKHVLFAICVLTAVYIVLKKPGKK